MSDLTREEKLNYFNDICNRYGRLACKGCPLRFSGCTFRAEWPDSHVDTVYEKVTAKEKERAVNMFDGDKINTASKSLSPNDIRKAAEKSLQQAEDQLGFKFNIPQCDEVTKMINERRDQEAKADAGKAEIRLVPMEIVWAIAWIRMYGNRKYGDPENWKTVEPERYRDALMRHLLAYISDPKSVDGESGYPHLWHAACNMAFLMRFDYGDMCHYDFAVKKPEWEKIGKTIDGQHHWTPCSLKLPDKEGEYLVTNDAGGMKNVEIDTFSHYEDDGKPFWMTSQNPIAWMPIPDVYEKKEES